MYSFDEDRESALSSRYPGGLQQQNQQRTRTGPVRRTEAQDTAFRERSALAKKAAMFKNSDYHRNYLRSALLFPHGPWFAVPYKHR
jgi:hypothetical protein